MFNLNLKVFVSFPVCDFTLIIFLSTNRCSQLSTYRNITGCTLCCIYSTRPWFVSLPSISRISLRVDVLTQPPAVDAVSVTSFCLHSSCARLSVGRPVSQSFGRSVSRQLVDCCMNCFSNYCLFSVDGGGFILAELLAFVVSFFNITQCPQVLNHGTFQRRRSS